MISLDDLTTPLTTEQVKQKIYDVMSALGVSTTSWKPGAVVRTMVYALAVVIAAFSQLTASIARGGFLELATGSWLTLVARYVYGVEREEATFASGEFTLVNSGGGIYALDPDDLIVSNPTTGKSYRNTEAFSLGAGATLTIPIRAVEAGAASTSTPGTITVLETTLTDVTGSNALAVVGLDAELDPALRTRCYEKLGSLSPMGPWDAYAYAARTAKTAAGIGVGVTRVRNKKDGYGNVWTYVATASGAVTGDADDPDTDLGAVNEAVQRLAAPLAVTAHTETAVAVVVPVTYQVWLYNTTGLTDQQVKDAIAVALASFFAASPIGGNVLGVDSGKIFRDAVITAIGATPSINSARFRVTLAAPAADVELDVNEVAVLGTVTGTVTQIIPGEVGF